MLKFLHKERGIKGVSQKLISDLRPQNFRPLEFFYKNYLHCKLVSGLILTYCFMVTQCSKATARRIEIFIFSGLSLSHRSNSENLTTFKIATDMLINDVCWRIFYQRNRKTESLECCPNWSQFCIHQTRQRSRTVINRSWEDKYLDPFWLFPPMNIAWP